jgi:2-iminobutanoate/2-iminopropanoate deaminase
MKIIYSKNAPDPIGPYSQAVLVNGLLYISGQIAIIPETEELMTGSIESETTQVMENIGSILKEASTDFSKIIKTSIFIKNMNDFTKINQIYDKYFIKNFPARETIEVSKLPKNCNIEISCIASVH